MPSPTLGRCRGCQVPIWFITVSNQAGKPPGPMPLNPGENKTGNVAVYQDDTGTWRGRVLRKGQQPAPYEHLYLPHFADCPKAAEFRQQVKKAQADLHRDQRNRRGRRPSRQAAAIEQPGLFRIPGETR